MAYKVIILYRLYMPSYFLGTFTEYPYWHKFNTITPPFYPLSKRGLTIHMDFSQTLSVCKLNKGLFLRSLLLNIQFASL